MKFQSGMFFALFLAATLSLPAMHHEEGEVVRIEGDAGQTVETSANSDGGSSVEIQTPDASVSTTSDGDSSSTQIATESDSTALGVDDTGGLSVSTQASSTPESSSSPTAPSESPDIAPPPTQTPDGVDDGDDPGPALPVYNAARWDSVLGPLKGLWDEFKQTEAANGVVWNDFGQITNLNPGTRLVSVRRASFVPKRAIEFIASQAEGRGEFRVGRDSSEVRSLAAEERERAGPSAPLGNSDTSPTSENSSRSPSPSSPSPSTSPSPSSPSPSPSEDDNDDESSEDRNQATQPAPDSEEPISPSLPSSEDEDPGSQAPEEVPDLDEPSEDPPAPPATTIPTSAPSIPDDLPPEILADLKKRGLIP